MRSGEASPSPARLLIVDDHHLVRGGMRALLEGEADLEVVGEAEDGQEALKLCRLHDLDLVLMDVRMPVMDGLAATRAIKEERPKTSILIATTHESQEYLLEAIRAGAAGYVLKEAPKRELLEAVRGVLEGETSLDRGLATRLLKRLAEETERRRTEPAPAAPPYGAPATEARRGGGKPLPEVLAGVLTPREIDILRMIAAGKTNREIAKGLVISLSTVKTHVQRIISKLGVSDRTQAAVKAVELGLPPE
jgi:DNA-binding NarL/FixJ family response regulator